ncbi:hypothetical protein AWB69_03874 [Caballeronia udeis]|uniref:Uncharacterized protein n=1 Tax=Caballeronia udeis TaxID=1232866 RepID=A0A158H518_9BURK|nr:hypothetical protein [Caballeronia udeis]SAL39247.1 hypothetical protein AWB69_03874 [Caballeronia udeis]
MPNKTEAVRDWLQNAAYGDRTAIARSAGILPLTALRVCHGQTTPRQAMIEKFEKAALIRRQALLEELLLVERVLMK